LSGILNKVYEILKKSLSQDELTSTDSLASQTGTAAESDVPTTNANTKTAANFNNDTSAVPLEAPPIKATVSSGSEKRSIPRLVENQDYYWEGRYMVMTAHYLTKRGYCCQSGCRHCPYGFRRGVGFITPAATTETDNQVVNSSAASTSEDHPAT
jgi:hypothetical protein